MPLSFTSPHCRDVIEIRTCRAKPVSLWQSHCHGRYQFSVAA
jgi:hypothetical protein